MASAPLRLAPFLLWKRFAAGPQRLAWCTASTKAQDFAKRWQRFFQTGTVCLYLTAGSHDRVVDTVVVKALGHSRKTVVRAPQDGFLAPKPIAGKFVLLEAQDHLDWLLEQLEVDFNSDQARLLPPLSDGQVVGILAFELNYPGDAALFAEKFERAASVAGAVLGLALNKEGQERWAERFAQPPSPRAAQTAIGQIIEEAVQLAGHKAGAEHVNAQVHISPEVKEVLVDPAQAVVADANIIANSIESYANPTGPVKIKAEPKEGRLRLQINDPGCGMDEATARKATSPFFSAKPVGRSRGMGLAHASRLIRLNGGTLEIESRPDHGTVVIIALPRE